MSEQHPVIISGAGPVGLTLAFLLAQQDIPVKIYDALPQLNPQSRASTFHPPTLEMFDMWGILDDVLQEAETVRQLQYFRREDLELVAAFDFGLIEGYTRFPYRIHYPQHQLTKLLYNRIQKLDGVEVNFNHRMTGFEVSDEGVLVSFNHPDGTLEIKGSFLCGADGAKSFIRRTLDIPFEGKTYDDRFLLVSSDANLRTQIPSATSVMYVFDPNEWLIVKQFQRGTRFTFRLNEHEDAELIREEKLVYQRISNFFPHLSYNIQHIGVYTVQQRVAETYHHGRVALLGDAAHLTNPIGGKGLNTGLHDAEMLAHTLAEIIKLDKPIDKLASYTEARRPIALEAIAGEDEAYTDMAATAHHDVVARNEKFREIATDLNLARQFLLRASMLEDRIERE